MRFSLRHRFSHTPERVAGAVLDPALERELDRLPHVAERRVTKLETGEDGRVHRVVHYRFRGDLPRAVVRTIGGEVITFDEVGDYDPLTLEWRFEIKPKVFRGGFQAHGTYRFVRDGEGSVREVDVDMRVNVPIVGGRVERAIRDGLVETLDAEARVIEAWLNGR